MSDEKRRPRAAAPRQYAKGDMKEESRRQRRLQKLRRQRLQNTIIMVFLLMSLAAGVLFLVYKLRGDTLRTLTVPYETADEFVEGSWSRSGERAETFASELCVADKSEIPMEGVALGDGQMGALLDLTEKEVRFAKGLYERVYPASITKLMTAILAIESGKLNDTVVIQQEDLDLESGSQVCGFLVGDKVTLNQLVHCLLVYSGNDAASAIARYVGGSQTEFVAMMNQYAAEWGMTGTHFENPHGLQSENHYTTTYDIYLMLNQAIQSKTFLEIAQLSDYTVNLEHADGTAGSITLASTDHYLTGEATPPKDVTVLGGKTGTTSDAGNCLALVAQNAYGQPFISIVMNASSKEVLYQQMNTLLGQINS
ncbi:MAG: D-alanyl-D-alanine carboxypeptidase family protein [Blautia sp.]